MTDSPRSLGDERTQAGLPSEAASPARSLGDQSTYAEGVSSVSDLGALAANLDETLELTDLAARYELGAVIGRGGMGEVLLARDKRLERPVAIKRILGEGARSATALRRFLTEARSLAQLNHFNIVQVFDYGRDAQGPFLILEYVAGSSLQEKLKAGSLPTEQAVDMACQLCDGLSAAHERGIIHRDVKPANVLLTERGEPKLTDFGLAHRESGDDGRTHAGAVLGTIDFMPPEQRRDATQADARSDLWSLAATLYQMLTGKSPKVIRLDQVPEALRAVLGKALEEEPAERYPTTVEFKAALRAASALLRSTPPQPSEAVLVEGVCPQCKTQNDLSRKFCKSCRSSLTVECLSCRTVIKVWEDVCGECGASQQEALSLIRASCETQLEEADGLGREYRFDEALALCESVTRESPASLAELRDRALTLTKELTERRLRRAIFTDAEACFAAAKYEEVLTQLEKVPAALCDTAVEELRSEAQRRILELTSLLTEIERLLPYREDEYDSREKLDRLEDLTARFLELQPNHDRVTRLQQATQFAKAESRHSLQSGHEQRPPAQPRPDQEACAKRLGATIEITNSIGMQLTLIPAGEFLMGSPDGDTDAGDDEKPQHKVRITKPYYLGIHAVTQGQWQSLMGTEPWKDGHNEESGTDYPATYVSWNRASKFCRRLSKKEGKTYRLPTEAEWEYACRAGTTTKYHFGDDESQLGDYAWYDNNAYNRGEKYAHAVGQKKPNAWGLYDLHGNVCEWCNDWDDAQYYGESPEADPQGPAEGSFRVNRGGSWDRTLDYCRSAFRESSLADERYHDHGFRVVLVPAATLPAATPTATSPVMALKPVAAAAASSPALKPDDMQMNSLGMKLTLIPAGEFLMGSPDGDTDAEDDEKPQHKVRITKPYYLGIHEVTQGQWQSLMGTEPWTGQIYVKAGTDYPATYVSWEEATEFCRKLSSKEGKTYRLPTEAEWEYACRAGTTTKYHFGEDESQLGDYAWYDKNAEELGESYAHAVGQKKPNAWGLYDLHGNVAEWCNDWCDEKYYGQSPGSDPPGPATGSCRVFRGGGWDDSPADCWSAYRNGNAPDFRQSGLGFRVVLVPAATLPAATPTATSPVTAPKPVAAAAASSPALKPGDMQMNSLGMKLTLIPAGEFLMGSPTGDTDAGDDEKPQHKVRITKPYYLGIHEVTQGQWQSLMGTEPWKGQICVKEGTDFAATYVSWEDATEFCRRLSKKEGKTYRLPTEAEWEYACRAGTTTTYHFVDDESQLGDYAWYDKNASNLDEKYAHAVGQKKPNAWGLYDMHGNVFELCSDYSDAHYYGQSPEADPQGPTNGWLRVERGGAWWSSPAYCRSADRSNIFRDLLSSGVGFRVALVPAATLPAATPTATSPVTASKPVAAAAASSPALKPGDMQMNSLGMKLTLIPAGEFLMGSPDGDAHPSVPKTPQHQVRITKPYYLGIHEVTQGQWQSLMGTEPWTGQRDYVKSGTDYPATYVSWEDATEFCRKLSKKEGKTYRLPTEAEWEYACRAGTTTKFHFGDDESQLGDYAWYDMKSTKKWYDVFWRVNYAHAVGQKKPNAWGLYDMHGNVSEWCSDWYDTWYYGQSPKADPQGPTKGSYRVHRGGYWTCTPKFCRSASRDRVPPDNRDSNHGFRVVLVP